MKIEVLLVDKDCNKKNCLNKYNNTIMNYNGLPVYDFVIDGANLGMTAISLVTKPAIESSFIAFNEAKPKKYVLSAAYKKQISGLALIPDKLIYRTEEGTDGYYGMFSVDTIEAIRNKFHKQKNTDNVNLQHNEEDSIEAYLVESYILDTQERVDECLAKGIEEAVLGAWFVSYKIDDADAFQLALDGDLTGFSIEIFLDKELKLNKNNKNNSIMSKFNMFIKSIKSLLNDLETETVQLTDAMLADGTKTVRYNAVGEPVNYVLVDEAGVETLELVPEGSYLLESGETLNVDANSNLLEVLPVETPVEPAEALEEVPVVPVPDVAVVEVEVNQPAAIVPDSDLNKTLQQLFDLSKDGDYYLSIYVQDGVVEYGSISTWQKMKLSEEKLSEVETLKAEIEALKVKLQAPIAEPVVPKAEPVKKFTKAEMAKMTNLEIQLNKLGLQNYK